MLLYQYNHEKVDMKFCQLGVNSHTLEDKAAFRNWQNTLKNTT